jgi:hypothetical protein
MFNERFEGSKKPIGSRQDVSFADKLMRLGPLKDEWDFIPSETLRSNIACELQKVHFDILMVNEYNVYYSPEAMTLKHAIIAAASVAEAVLEVAVKMIEDDPRVAPIIQTREQVFEEFKELSLTGFTVPDGLRVVTGVQREVVKGKLDRHTKMDLLIRAAKASGVIDEEMAKKLQRLRRFRNRVHIKTVEELEYASYTHGVANAMLDILEEFRLVVKPWIVNKTVEDFNNAMAALVPAAAQFASAGDYDIGPPVDDFEFEVGPPADDDVPF